MKLSRPGPGAVIFAVALLLRVAWVWLRWTESGAALEFPDEVLHWQLAQNFVSDGALVSDDGRFAARMPLYPLFLALSAWCGTAGVLVARLAQAVLGAATTWVAFALADKAFGRRGAFVAGLLVCLDPYAVFFANLLLTEVLFSFLAIALVACTWPVVAGSERPVRWAAVGVAVLGAAALMTRPSTVGWIVLLWLVLWLFDGQRRWAARRLGLQIGVLAICLGAWGLRNYAVIGAPAWLSTNGGVTLYDAQGPQADGSSDQAFLSEMPELVALTEVERDSRLRALAIEQMRKDPARVLSLARAKLLRTWSLTPNVGDYRGGMTGIVSALFTAAVLLAAFVGLARTGAAKLPAANARRLRRMHVLLWLPVVYFTLLHCVFIGSLRYRVPLMPFLEIAAASAVVQTQARRTATC